MGACDFSARAKGKTAKEAFQSAVSDARYEHGHGGYTGTIAEKGNFRMVTPKPGEKPTECMSRLMDDEKHFCQDKWGDAACVQVAEGEFLFFGWASS